MAVTAAMDMYSIQLCWLPGRLRRQASSHSLIAGCQVDWRRLSGRLREQARSHSWIVGCQVDRCRLGGRHRRQASSHTGHALPTKSAPGTDPLWSGLAREGGVSVTEYSTEPPLSQANSLPYFPGYWPRTREPLVRATQASVRPAVRSAAGRSHPAEGSPCGIPPRLYQTAHTPAPPAPGAACE